MTHSDLWNKYSTSFLSINPSKMLEMNKEVAQYASGKVCDFGCGAAKISPFILNNKNVASYTGIDASKEMTKLARWHLQQFPKKPSTIIEANLEDIGKKVDVFKDTNNSLERNDNELFDFAISINSYYAWKDPEVILSNIFSNLKPNAGFILVTPNKNIDMRSLLEEAKMELVANPLFTDFSNHNLTISEEYNQTLMDMDELISQVRHIGFKIQESHQRFYNNGLNFILMSS